MSDGGDFLETVARILLLRDYNTRLVVLSTALLGLASGLIGSFLLLRGRALLGDAIAHATFPGVVIAFMILVALGADPRSLPVLLIGAAAAGGLGCLVVILIREHTRIRDDAAMGIVLSVFFGGGVALMGVAQHLPQASAAGLEGFLYGKTAAMLRADFNLLSASAVVAMAASLLLFKEFRLLCFDEGFARSLGWPVRRLDGALLVLVAGVTVVGLQTVGAILIIAFLIIPAASARQWTPRFGRMLGLAAFFGGLSGWLGSSFSALMAGLPAGAVIVLAATGVFLLSLLFGSDRGWLRRLWMERRLRVRVRRQHLLRALYEILEKRGVVVGPPPVIETVEWEELLPKRTWRPRALRRMAWSAYNEALLEPPEPRGVRFTERGFREAVRITRNHRLWELYLIEHAEVAPSHVDRDADAVEHILGPSMIRQLEALAAAREIGPAPPPSPHPLP